MKYADARAEALALLRFWAARQIRDGVSVKRINRDLQSTLTSIIEEFRIAHDVPGVRYWYISPGEEFVTTMVGEPPPIRVEGVYVEEVGRWFFLGKQHLGNPDDHI